MEIVIDDKITIDTSKSFDEQSSDAQQYLYDLMNSKQGKLEYDSLNRPLRETWVITEDCNIVRTSVYINQNYNWNLQSQTLTFEEVINE